MKPPRPPLDLIGTMAIFSLWRSWRFEENTFFMREPLLDRPNLPNLLNLPNLHILLFQP